MNFLLGGGGGGFEVPGWRPFGAKVLLHWSAIILLAFFVYLTYSATMMFPALTQAGLCVASAIICLLSIVLHELAHALAFHLNGNRVSSILLYAFGGLTTAEGVEGAHSTCRSKTAPIVISVVGPLSNAVPGGILLGITYALPSSSYGTWWGFLIWWIGYINLFLAVFNMLPGVPLDGSSVVVGLFRCCFPDYKAKIVGYSVGIFVLVGVGLWLILGFHQIATALYLALLIAFTVFAMSEVYNQNRLTFGTVRQGDGNRGRGHNDDDDDDNDIN